MNKNLSDIGFLKHMLDRFRANISYLQMPLLFYTAIVSTLNYVPWLSGYLSEVLIFSVGLFFIFAVVAIYLDYKFIFPAERNFMFRKTPHLEKRFNEISEKLDKVLNEKE